MIDTEQDEGTITITVTPRYAKPVKIQVVRRFWRHDSTRINGRWERTNVYMYDLFVGAGRRTAHRLQESAVRKAMSIANRYDKAYEVDRSRGLFTPNY